MPVNKDHEIDAVIGNIVAYKRYQDHKNQKQIAREMGIREPLISQLEHGFSIDQSIMGKIAPFLEIPSEVIRPLAGYILETRRSAITTTGIEVWGQYSGDRSRGTRRFTQVVTVKQGPSQLHGADEQILDYAHGLFILQGVNKAFLTDQLEPAAAIQNQLLLPYRCYEAIRQLHSKTS